MDEQKWAIFVNHYCCVISFWEIIKAYRTKKLRGAFFSFLGLAARNELLMRIAHSVKLCEEIVKEYDVGDDAKFTLGEIKSLFEKGDTPDRSALKFENCGIKPFRDKILAHPLNQTKAVLGKPEYEISLQWETVEATLSKIKVFADQVEEHYRQAGRWNVATYKDGIAEVEDDFRAVMAAMEDGEKYNKLRREVMLKGKATVSMDWKKREIVIEK